MSYDRDDHHGYGRAAHRPHSGRQSGRNDADLDHPDQGYQDQGYQDQGQWDDHQDGGFLDQSDRAPEAGYGYPTRRGERPSTRPYQQRPDRQRPDHQPYDQSRSGRPRAGYPLPDDQWPDQPFADRRAADHQSADYRRPGYPARAAAPATPAAPPGKAGLSRNAKIGIGAGAALVLVALGAALGGGSSPTTGTTGTSVAAVAPVAESVAPIAGGSVAPAVTVAPTTPAVRKAVPNVVGMGHQAAQDALQAAGFYNLAEEDATGQGRLLILDRNWRVVAQVPASGSVISTDDRMLLRSKKITDP